MVRPDLQAHLGTPLALPTPDRSTSSARHLASTVYLFRISSITLSVNPIPPVAPASAAR
jgi:hypothetical protein